MQISEAFMRTALEEARKAEGHTSPNPLVGAVLAIGNRIATRAHHRRAGSPHAEIECLRKFGRKIPNNAVLYVTLEPCSTAGRTPACTQEIIKLGVKRVVVGSIDPNPKHSGRGIELLRSAGVNVAVGVLAEECTALNPAFNKWIATGMPFVIGKCAMSLDGHLSRPGNEPRWISSSKSRAHARALRGKVDAIVVGANTVRTDNPRLTVRGVAGAGQPLRVILTRSGKFSKRSHVFTDRFRKRTLIYRSRSLRSVLHDLGQQNVSSVVIEGGGEILGEALDAGLIDRAHIYLGPILTGGGTIAFAGKGAGKTSAGARLQAVKYQKIGQDVWISGDVRYGPWATE